MILDVNVLVMEVYIDEIFFTCYPRDLVTKDGKKLKGISRNKICVAVVKFYPIGAVNLF